jgi:hypothetical protein
MFQSLFSLLSVSVLGYLMEHLHLAFFEVVQISRQTRLVAQF